jgi:hypothetical protein
VAYEVVPDLLHGVEPRSVRRERFQMQPGVSFAHRFAQVSAPQPATGSWPHPAYCGQDPRGLDLSPMRPPHRLRLRLLAGRQI